MLGMLASRPSYAIGTNIFREIWTSHRSLSFLDTGSRRQTPRFHTLGFVQKPEEDLDEHKKTINMFQQAIIYNTQMTNILLRLSDLEIKDK